MVNVDLDRIREALPDRASVKLIKYRGKSPAIECKVQFPSLSEGDFDMVLDWQREIIGKENILEFYTEETGGHWYVFLKRVPMEFRGATDADVNSFSGMEVVKDGKRNTELPVQ
ncbi:MAG: hypothetical protein ACRBG0_19175 [Lewinella sp.]|uniref:hypothetical protein n=1 Tax=Lewinella sp. TaxID=2004506 RepID=UPI003D6B5134